MLHKTLNLYNLATKIAATKERTHKKPLFDSDTVCDSAQSMISEEFQNGINIEEQLFPSRSYPHCCIPSVAQYVNNIVEIPRNTQVLKDLDFYDDNNSSL